AGTADNDLVAYYNQSSTRKEFNLTDPGFSGTRHETQVTCRGGIPCESGSYFELKDSWSGKYAWFVIDPAGKTDDTFFAEGGSYPEAYVYAQSRYGSMNSGQNYSTYFYWNDPVYDCDS
ncbi:MAG: hypothetical protein ACXABY_27625, partial [Candidatus Thorarchaeota archaeon]